jgi:hypothetical protein
VPSLEDASGRVSRDGQAALAVSLNGHRDFGEGEIAPHGQASGAKQPCSQDFPESHTGSLKPRPPTVAFKQ